MGGDIAAWCALRGLTVTLQDQNAKALRRRCAGRQAVHRALEGRRASVRDATDRLIPDVAGNGIARADVIIEAIFENVDAKRALFAARREEGEARRDPRDEHVEHPARGDRVGACDPTRLVGIHFFNPVARMMLVEVVHGARHRPTLVERGRGFRAPDRQAAVAGEERARVPREPHPRAVHDGGVSRGRRGHRAGNGRRGSAGVRHADGADRARRHGGARHRRRRRQAARRRRSAAAQAQRARRSGQVGKKTGRGFYAWVERQAGQAGRRRGAGGAGRTAGAAVRRRGEGRAGGGHRRRRGPGRCRRDLRHRLRAVPRRAAALCVDAARTPAARLRSRCRWCSIRGAPRDASRTSPRTCETGRTGAERVRHRARASRRRNRGQGLAQAYPKGIPAHDRRDRIRVGPRGVRGERAASSPRGRRSPAWARR